MLRFAMLWIGIYLGLLVKAWVAQHAPSMAVVWPVLLLCVFVPLAVRRYRRLSR